MSNERSLECQGAPEGKVFTPAFRNILCVNMSFGFAFAVFALLPKFLATELRADAGSIGLVVSIFGLAGVASIPLTGPAIDRFGRSALMVTGSALIVLSSLGYLWVREVSALVLVLRFFQGLAWSLVFNAGLAWVADTAPPSKLGEAIGYFGIANLGMNAVAPAVMEPLVDRYGWEPAFLGAAFAGLLAMFFSYRVPRAERSFSAAERRGTWEVCTRKTSLSLSVVVGLSGMALGAMFTFHQPFALQLGIGKVRGFFIAYTAAAVVVRLLLGQLADRLGRYRVCVCSLTLYGLTVMWMSRLTPALLPVIGGVFGLAHGFFFPAFNALIVERAHPAERGLLMTLCNGAFNAGLSVSVILLGALAQRTGYPPIFLVAGGGTLVGVVVLLLVPPHEPSAPS